jgi:hypothetical protein
MGKAEDLLFRKGLKILKAYKSSGIPFTGIYGTSLINWGLNGEHALKAWFRRDQDINNLQVGTACLGLAEEQLKILQCSGEEARQVSEMQVKDNYDCFITSFHPYFHRVC